MHDLASDHSHVGGDVADGRFGDGQRIGTQDREVGELAGLEGALLVLIEGAVSAVLGGTAER